MSLQPEYFDGVYADGPDPWGFAHRWYEQRKRAVLLASLPRRRFLEAFEPGCGTGELTAQLARRCDRLLATDIADSPLATTSRRLAGTDHVSVERLAVPRQWPSGRRFDLVVVCEIGYYLDAEDLVGLLDATATSLTENGMLVTCHWRHPAPDYPLTGDAVVAQVAAAGQRHGWVHLVGHVEEDFALDVHGAPGAVSVARADGML